MQFVNLKALNEWDSRHMVDMGDGEEKFEGFMIKIAINTACWNNPVRENLALWQPLTAK